MTSTIVPDVLHDAPAIFAETRYDGTSDKFQFISTATVIDAMRTEGFIPVRAKQTVPRVQERHPFARHVVIFRVPDQAPLRRGDLAPEIVLFNAHDGTSSYRLHAGIFRLVCENGLVVSTGSLDAVRIPHSRTQTTVDQVLESTQTLVRALPTVVSQIDTWQGTTLTESQRRAFARAALPLRFGEAAPVTPEQVLEPRRVADTATDLFTIMNVVQENLLRGGLAYRTPTGRQVKTRRLNAIDATTRLNLGLWDLAAQFSYSLN